MHHKNTSHARESSVLTKDGELALIVKPQGHGILINCETRGGVNKGAVLVSNRAKGSGDKPLFQVYNDGLFSAIRGQAHHMPGRYDAEEATVRMHRGSLAWALETSWNLSRDDDAGRQEFEQALRSVALDMNEVENEFKLDALADAMKAARTTDARGRFNPASRSPLILRCFDRLGKRLDEIPVIRKHTDPRRFALGSVVDGLQEVMLNACGQVKTVYRRLGKVEHSKRSRQPMNREDLLGPIRGARKLFSAASVAPWSTHLFPHCLEDLSLAEGYVEGQRFALARERLEVVLSAMSAFPVQLRAEEALTAVSVAKSRGERFSAFDAACLSREIEGMHKSLAKISDEGWRNPILGDVRAGLDRAKEAAEAPSFDAGVAYDALRHATKCF